ncbi:MAG TPA: hypothetical protein VK974_10585 [Methylophilaceae bacterium]|nr:hypothetical protein [Methylophilaceae bacterium]
MHTRSFFIVIPAAILLSTALQAAEPEAVKPAASPEGEQVKWIEADADQDGRVTQDEYLAAGLERLKTQFKNSDLNGDGAIDKAETAIIKERIKALRALKRANQNAAASEKPKEPVPATN